MTSRVEARRSKAARRRGLWPDIKGWRCARGRLSAAGYPERVELRLLCGGGRLKQRGVERGRRGLVKAVAAAVGPPAPAGGPESAGRGPGGPAPGRPQSW